MRMVLTKLGTVNRTGSRCRRPVLSAQLTALVSSDAWPSYHSLCSPRPRSSRHSSSSASGPSLESVARLGQDEAAGRALQAVDVPLLGHLRQPSQLPPTASGAQGTGDATQSRTESPILAPSRQGEWESLLFDYDRLVLESNFGPGSSRPERLIDQPEHRDDLGLWGAIFNFCYRRHGREGAIVTWKEIIARRALHQTDGVAARDFWQTVVEAALEDEAFLESTWVYAEWMKDWHGTQWPNYYRTIVSFCLKNRQFSRALRWHLRLSPHFDPGRKGFFDMLEAFILDRDPSMQEALQSIYATSRHRQLYDTIIPFLWSHGYLFRALSWRSSLLIRDDKPTSGLSRPFLRHLAGYGEKNQLELSPEELAVSKLHQPEEPQRDDDNSSSIFHFVNRIHGRAFGISEKSFNDRLGARWFASSWIPMDTAIGFVHDLGVAEIGPLSLQSIALREDSPAGILQRLEQLEKLQISRGQSNYVRAVRHLARVGDSDTLRELLNSDLHPDVFDDAGLQGQLLGASACGGDWKTYRLIFTARLAVSEGSLAAAASDLLRACLESNRKDVLMMVLDEVHARGIEIDPSFGNAISQLIMDGIDRPFDPNAIPDVDFYIALCRRAAAMRLPVATRAWHKLLTILAEQQRLDDLESLALDIVRQYSAMDASDWSTMKAHGSDIPEAARQEAPHRHHLLPRDLPWRHPLHPVQMVFDDRYTKTVVRSSFGAMLLHRQALGVAAEKGRERPADYQLARGVKLLAMLKERKVNIRTRVVRETVIACLTKLYGPRSMVRQRHQKTRAVNRHTVEEVKEMVDEAWGSELLPPVAELEGAWKAVEGTAAGSRDGPDGSSKSHGHFKREVIRQLRLARGGSGQAERGHQSKQT